METFTYTVDGKEFELKHYGVKGMKWGKRKPRYIPVGNAGGGGARSTSSGESPEAQAARKEARRQKAVRAAKIGAAVVGTALAAYGTYKLAQHMQNKRSSAAYQKAQDYINNNVVHRVEHTKFRDGTQSQLFKNAAGNYQFQQYRGGANVSKAAGQHNARVIAEGRQMYKNATNTRLDRGLAKVVNTGDAIGSKARSAANKAKDATSKAVKKATNPILDVINPQYEYVPENKVRKYYDSALNANITETWTDYHKRQKKRR